MTCNPQHITVQGLDGKWTEYYAVQAGKPAVIANDIAGPENASRTPPEEILINAGHCPRAESSQAPLQVSEDAEELHPLPAEEPADDLALDRLPGLRARREEQAERQAQQEVQENIGSIVPDIYQQNTQVDSTDVGTSIGEWIFLGVIGVAIVGGIVWAGEKHSENQIKRELARRKEEGYYDYLTDPEEEDSEGFTEDDSTNSDSGQPVVRMWMPEPAPWGALEQGGAHTPTRPSNNLGSGLLEDQGVNERPGLLEDQGVNERPGNPADQPAKLAPGIRERLKKILEKTPEIVERAGNTANQEVNERPFSNNERAGDTANQSPESSEIVERAGDTTDEEHRFGLKAGFYCFEEIHELVSEYNESKNACFKFFSQKRTNLEHVVWGVFGIYKSSSKQYKDAIDQVRTWRTEWRENKNENSI